MKKKIKVSIIIPVYNGEKYIRQAIDSALSQTYKNIEIIVVNDGSTDKTEEIVLSYGNKIRYFSKENGGVSTALNLGIEKMQGEYFSWLSHDDLYEKTKIERQVKQLHNYDNKTILLSDYSIINAKGHKVSDVYLDHEEITRHHTKALFNGMINGITLLIPKEAFVECGKFDPNLRCTQDYDMWYKMLSKGYRFVHINEILAMSRQHVNQTTNTSPVMINEGNDLWIKMIKAVPLKMKIDMSGNEYNFYREMYNFLKQTQYKVAERFAFNEMEIRREKIYKNLEQVKVSVIIPFYNNEITELNRAISSVINQSHKNVEIILINDGSTRKYTDFIKEIKKNSLIKYIEIPKNNGPAYARNIGLENISGSYIAFLDADDQFLQDKIHKQLVEMLLSEANISHTSYYLYLNNKKMIIDSGKQTGNVVREVIYSCKIATPTVMIKSGYLKQRELKFNTDIKIGEDICFWLTILEDAELLGIDEPLTIVNSTNSSAAYNLEKQIAGTKNILRFVLNNNKLQDYDAEISILASYYFSIVSRKYKLTSVMLTSQNHYYEYQAMLNSRSWKITAPLRYGAKCYRYIKNNGFVSFFKKVKLRIERKAITKNRSF
ncbi:MAG: glycosyltransferase family 2 protein [Bacilli bacterium]|jgi:glycosyltransferase involved in cell wall biosynthesis